jgi:alkylated DNA repair dioxygenase AlkB
MTDKLYPLKLKIPLKDCSTYYDDSFFDEKTATNYLTKLLETINLTKKPYEGRMTALHGDAKKYKYALNNDAVPLPWTLELLEIKTIIEKLTGYKYNVCLLNYYKDGKEKFGFHADNEEIGNTIPIAVISLGAKRKFYYKSLTDPDDKHCIKLAHGSLLLMDPKTHEKYLHALPPDNTIKEHRLSLTFRFTKEE